MQKIIPGNWFSPINYLKKLKSTVKVDYVDQSNSAGDWSGWLLKKVGNKYKLFLFNQENNYSGFTLSVSKTPIATFKEIPDDETIIAINHHHTKQTRFY